MSGAALASAQPRCNPCGAELAGAYCQNCGQPSVAVRRSFGDVIYGQTGRLLHSLWLLFTRPGELAREIDEARDRRSMRPGALLTNLIAVFFLAAGGVGGFSAQTVLHEDRTGYMASLAAERAAARGLNEAVYQERLESRFRSEYSILITLTSFSYAFAFWVVERRRRKPWLVHLAAGIQYLCITFIVTAVMFGVARLTGLDLQAHPAIGLATIAILAGYIVLTLRRVYGDSLPMAAAKMLFVLCVGVVSDTLLQYASLVIAILTA
jgi:hypothetical protein